MTAHTMNAFDSDADLWRLVLEGNTSAFEVLVRRHQSLVSAVAFSACGNLALSEDVAQETFWTAWRHRASLEQPGRLNSWLCGIARGFSARTPVARRRGPRSRPRCSMPQRRCPRMSPNPPRPRCRAKKQHSSGRHSNACRSRTASR